MAGKKKPKPWQIALKIVLVTVLVVVVVLFVLWLLGNWSIIRRY